MTFQEVRVLVLDPSLRSTGFYRSDNRTWGTISPKYNATHNEALVYLGSAVTGLCDQVRPDLLVLEDYTPSSKGHKATHSMGECRGVIVYCSRGIPIVTVPIQTWKSQTIKRQPKGNAFEKREYIAEAQVVCGVDGFETTDEADATMIYLACLRLLGNRPQHKVTKAIRAVLEQATLFEEMAQ